MSHPTEANRSALSTDYAASTTAFGVASNAMPYDPWWILSEIAGKIDDLKVNPNATPLTEEEKQKIDQCAKLSFKTTEAYLRTDWEQALCHCSICEPIDFGFMESKLRDALLDNRALENVFTERQLEIVKTCAVLNYIRERGALRTVSDKWFSVCSPTCVCNTPRR